MKRQKTPSMGMFTIGIAALFLVGFLLLVLFGAVTYQRTVDSQNRNNGERSILSYLSAVTKANDREGAFSVEDSSFGRMIVIREKDGFGLRIYHADGKLLEEYSRLSIDPDPSSATVIADTERFELEEVKPGFWRIVTDQGESLLTLRTSDGR